MTTRLLTPMEEQVARLVSTGRSNPEVAEELGLTRKTVEWHLSRVYRKLGARSRAELALLLQPRRAGGLAAARSAWRQASSRLR